VYSIALSYLYLTQILYLHSGYLQLFAQCVATWLAVKYCRSSNKSKSWTWAIFLGNMGLLTVNHFARYISNTSLDIVEITGSQMVLVMKLSLFAWAAYDGGRPVDQLDPVQKRDRLTEVPGLLPFLGYW
jgi:lysophospholipid acyltransferase